MIKHVARAVAAAFGLLVLLVGPAAPVLGQTYPPPTDSWVYDLAGVIDAADEEEIVRTFERLSAETGIDTVAVTIDSVDDYAPGQSIDEFGKSLFNHWGIGDAGIDDGVLLLVAVADREARVTIGDGFTDRYVGEAQRVIDAMLGSFRQGDYSGGILTGARLLAANFRSLDGSPATAPPGSDRGPNGGGSTLRRLLDPGYDNEDGGLDVPSVVWYVAGGGGAALFGAGGFVTWQRIKPRKCPQCSREMKRLKGRKAEEPFLSRGQNLEERYDSVEYDVFECVSCGTHKVERHNKLFSRFDKCPQCAFKTMTTTRRTLVAATYDHGGKDLITQDCKHCEYHHEREVSTPRRTRSTSSSRSSFGSSSGSRGPSGGGRSSGRGASGSW